MKLLGKFQFNILATSTAPPHTVHLKSLPISALLTLTFNGLSGGDFNY